MAEKRDCRGRGVLGRRRPRASFQHLEHTIDHFTFVTLFADESVSAHFHRSQYVRGVTRTGQHDHGNVAPTRVLLDTLAQIEAAGIEVLAKRTETACQVYNQRKDEGDVIAALHLTC